MNNNHCCVTLITLNVNSDSPVCSLFSQIAGNWLPRNFETKET